MRRFGLVLACTLGAAAPALACSDSGDDDGSTGDGDGTAGGDGDGDGDSTAGGDGDGDGSTGDGDGGDGDGDGSTGDGDGGGDPLYGFFNILLTAADEGTGNEAFTSLQGSVRTSAPVESIDWVFEREENDCELLVPVFPFCDPECELGTVCAPGDQCVAEAEAVSIGDVTFTGLETESGEPSFMVSPIGARSNYLLPGTVSVAYPPAEEGAPISVSGSIDGQPLSIEAYGIGPLVVDHDEVPVGENQDVTVTWQAPGEAAQSEMEIVLEISHHGGVKGEVICKTADDGEHTLPASIVTDLIDLGVAGFPTITFTRVSRGTSEAPHEIVLSVSQNVQIPVALEGLTSCTSDDDCPDGQSCQLNKACE